MPVKTNAHQTQFPATPVRRTMSVTRFGVSLEKVVATIESPASHHGTLRPDAKKFAVEPLDLRATRNAGQKQISSVIAMTTQSRVWRRMRGCMQNLRSFDSKKHCESTEFRKMNIRRGATVERASDMKKWCLFAGLAVVGWNCLAANLEA